MLTLVFREAGHGPTARPLIVAEAMSQWISWRRMLWPDAGTLYHAPWTLRDSITAKNGGAPKAYHCSCTWAP